MAALLCRGGRLSARWGPPKTAGLEGTGLRWAAEGWTEEPWSTRRLGKGRGACELSGPGQMGVLGAWRHPCGQCTAQQQPDKHAGRAGGCSQRVGSREFARAALSITRKVWGRVLLLRPRCRTELRLPKVTAARLRRESWGPSGRASGQTGTEPVEQTREASETDTLLGMMGAPCQVSTGEVSKSFLPVSQRMSTPPCLGPRSSWRLAELNARPRSGSEALSARVTSAHVCQVNCEISVS